MNYKVAKNIFLLITHLLKIHWKSSNQSSSLGYKFGKLYIQMLKKEQTIPSLTLEFSSNSTAQYTIQMITRTNKIVYLNQKNNKSYSLDPKTLISIKELISNFDSTQAFYIGFLAALNNK